MFLQPRGVIGCYLSHRKFWQMVNIYIYIYIYIHGYI
jgi:GR25 family glycosyltransferase involved in LPS biosynthesis